MSDIPNADPEANNRLDIFVDEVGKLAQERGINLTGILLVERVSDGYNSKIAVRMEPEKMRKILFSESMEDEHWENAYHR